jgi:hypothetical protein
MMAAGFVSLDRGSQDQAARAGVALAVRRLEKAAEFDAGTVGEVAHNVLAGLWAFPASSYGRWATYAQAVHEKGEKISNRKWYGYSSVVRAAALEVADHVEELVRQQREEFPTAD